MIWHDANQVSQVSFGVDFNVYKIGSQINLGFLKAT